MQGVAGYMSICAVEDSIFSLSSPPLLGPQFFLLSCSYNVSSLLLLTQSSVVKAFRNCAEQMSDHDDLLHSCLLDSSLCNIYNEGARFWVNGNE